MYLLFETDRASDTEREHAPTTECSNCHQQVSAAESLRLGGRCVCFNCASFDDE